MSLANNSLLACETREKSLVKIITHRNKIAWALLSMVGNGNIINCVAFPCNHQRFVLCFNCNAVFEVSYQVKGGAHICSYNFRFL